MNSGQELQLISGEPLTEDKAAEFFQEKYLGKLAYCFGRGKWAEFDGSIWRFQDTPAAFDAIRLLVRDLTAGTTKNLSTTRKVKFCEGVEKFSRASAVMRRSPTTWDKDPFLLGTPTGTVDLATGRFRDAIPGDYITKSTAVVPVDAPCPVWTNFLNEVTANDKELIRFLQQMAGYALTADTREHALFFIYGAGGNGKSVFLNTISRIIGDYAVTSDMETFTASKMARHSTEIASLQGARLVTASETDEGRPWAEARIKQMTGGDPIRARFMRQDSFEFQPNFKLVIVGNHQPELRQVDEAMRRRFNILPFTVTPKSPDRKLEEKLKAEWPMILSWMIKGCLDWRANGLVQPDSVIKATNAYFEEQDVFGQWLESTMTVDRENHSLSARAEALFKSYAAYAKAAGIEPGNTKTFSQVLRKAGFEKKKYNVGTFYVGIAFPENHSENSGG